MNPLHALDQHGQSVWFDYIQRSLIWTGQLHRMVTDDGLKGLTSSPTTFDRAMGDSPDYSPALAALVADGLDPREAYEQLAVEDLRWACDVLQGVYYDSDGRDGFCCLPVSPHVADDPMEIFDEANRLWEMVGRDNLMITVAGTQSALTVLPELISHGINVNVTMLFSPARYQAVHDAYIQGIEELVRAGGDPSSVASVASFFVSRIDTLIDSQIDAQVSDAEVEARPGLTQLRGRAATAIAKLAYRAYQTTVASDRWTHLADQGARPQRLLWSSTVPADPLAPATRYVEALIAPDTIVSLAPSTYEALRDSTDLQPSGFDDVGAAIADLSALADAGISIDEATALLEEEAAHVFIESYDRLVATVQSARVAIMGEAQPSMDLSLGEHDAAVETLTSRLDDAGFTRRLWARDSSLFDPESKYDADPPLGWLDVVEEMGPYTEGLVEFQDRLEADEVESVVLVGMGGSSLAADAWARMFGQLDGSPELLVLDSTVPAQIRAVEAEISPEETVFIVASKSGQTVEALSLGAYFGQSASPDQFVAITDPESELEATAAERGFSGVFPADPEIGGRYAALSPFGMVPAAAMGLDTDELLDRAQLMVGSCSEAVPAYENPGVLLGAAIGELAKAGRDKLAIVLSPALEGLGPWLQQLIAESTGKDDKGIVPVIGESLAGPDRYGDDRAFVYIALEDDDGDTQSDVLEKLDALHSSGHPVLTFALSDLRDVAQEMFRWQIAAATAGFVIGVNPFDQPDVQVSKTLTNELLEAYVRDGTLPEAPNQRLLATTDGLSIFADAKDVDVLEGSSVQDVLRNHLGRARPGDYVSVQAFIEMSEANNALLDRIRLQLSEGRQLATMVDIGPRYLHVTGQLHKGGRNRGLFLQLTCDDPEDIPIPEQGYSFGVLKAAQQTGDFMAMVQRDRRIVRVHLGTDVPAGLDALARALTSR